MLNSLFANQEGDKTPSLNHLPMIPHKYQIIYNQVNKTKTVTAYGKRDMNFIINTLMDQHETISLIKDLGEMNRTERIEHTKRSYKDLKQISHTITDISQVEIQKQFSNEFIEFHPDLFGQSFQIVSYHKSKNSIKEFNNKLNSLIHV